MADIKRLNYFTHQFLEENDFKDEQFYHLDMRRRHNKGLHVWGIAYGLEISGVANGNKVTIAPGMAIDNKGREIVLETNYDVSLPSDQNVKTDYYLLLVYIEKKLPKDNKTHGGVTKSTRTTESLFDSVTNPKLSKTKGSNDLILGKITVTKDGGLVKPFDLSERRATDAKKAIKLSIDNHIPSEWPDIKGFELSAVGSGLQGIKVNSKRTIFSGDLEVDGDLIVKGADIKDAGGTSRISIVDNGALQLKEDGGGVALTINTSGNVGIGTATTSEKFVVNGKVKATAFLGDGSKLTGISTGKWSDGAGGVITYKGGNVGIGTSTPKANLHTVGDLVLGLDTNNKKFVFHSRTNSNGDFLQITHDKSNGSWDWGQGIALKRGGNVGIGTANPGAKLEVNGDIKTNVALISDNPHGINYAAFSHKNQGTTGGYALLQHKDGETYLNTPSGKNINFRINNATKMMLRSNGNFGIGAGLPGHPLHVTAGITNSWQSRFTNGEANVYLNHQGGYGMHINTGKSNSNARYGLQVRNKDRTHLYVRDDGYIGIGKTNPDRTLDISSTNPYPLIVRSNSGYMFCGAGNPTYFHFHTDRQRYYFNKPTHAVGGFHTFSTLKKKKDVKYLSRVEENEIYEAVKAMSLATFRYKDLPVSGKVHLGVIAEKSPRQILSDSGDSVDLYSYSSFGLAAIKAQQHKMDDLSAQMQEQQSVINRLKYVGVGTDFAEYFESVDGKAIEAATSVVFEKDKVRSAKKGEVPFGVISMRPGMLCGSAYEWPKKYLKDEFGNEIMEEYKEEIMVQKTEKVKRERQKVKTNTIEEEVVEKVKKKIKGKTVLVGVKKKIKRKVDEPQFNKIDLYDEKGKKKVGTEQVPVMETYEEEEPVYDDSGEPVMIGSGKFEKKIRPKVNSDYDPKREYIPREERPEWNIVGLIGQIPVSKGQPIAPTWVRIKTVSKDIELWLVK